MKLKSCTKNSKILNLSIKGAVIILGILLFAVLVKAASDYYRVNVGNVSTINEHGICRVVTNSGSKDIFIPTKTAGEWSAFIANKPADVSLSSCGYEHTDGYGHYWTSLSPQLSQQVALEACQHFYSDNPCQCGWYCGASVCYATYAVNCSMGAPGFSGHTCCNQSWATQKILEHSRYSWVYLATGWCGMYVGVAGNCDNNCCQPFVNWY